jgi:flagellar protein FlgJ
MQRLPQSFRSYGSLAEGVQDYFSLISNSPRYAAALNTGNDVQAFATALKQGGYATDPDYVQKLVDTAASVRRLMHDASLKSTAQPPIPAGNGTV